MKSKYDYSQHKYKYNKEYPLVLFFKDKKCKKNLKKKDKNLNIKSINKNIDCNLPTENIISNSKSETLLNAEFKKILFPENKNITKIDTNGSKNSRNIMCKDIHLRKQNSIKKVEKLISNYYSGYRNSMFNNLEKNTNLFNENIDSIKSKSKYICQINSEMIYIYYDLYDYFLKYVKRKELGSDLYREFKIFIKKNCNMYIENVKPILLYKYMKISYELIIGIDNEIIKDKIIKIFSMLKLNIDVLYKLNVECLCVLKDFIKEKYKRKNICNLDNFSTNSIKEKIDVKDINKLCSEIPISYIGSKRKIASKIISSIFINDNINNYIELCGGSLCISYIIKRLYPHINITVYENDTFLSNFYLVLKNKYNEFILKLQNILDELKNTVDKKKYLQNIVSIINNNLDNINKNNFDGLELACYYYIVNKISFRSNLNYNKGNKINITVNENRVNLLLKFGDKHERKLLNYSTFLNSIKLINKDICENYEKILNNIDNKTIMYVDPPYYGNNDNYRFYQNNFNKDKYIKLKEFLDDVFKIGCKWIKSNGFSGYIMELFEKYKKNIINLRNDISNSMRMELLITSF